MNKEQEDSKEYFPLDERLKKVDAIADVVDIEYAMKYDFALQLAEAQIDLLQKENASLQNQNELLQEDNLAMTKVIAQYKIQDKLNELM